MKLGKLSFDPRSGELRRGNGQAVPLKRRAKALLQALANADGRILSKDSLMQTVWPDVIVSEDSLYQAVAEARRALGSQGAPLIISVSGQGYRLETADTAFVTRRWWPLVASLTLAVACVAALLWSQNLPTATEPRHPVIAVLPFEGMPGDDLWQRRGRGLSVELATELARNDWLDVIAPEASETQAGRQPLAVADILGARFLLDGALAAENGALRVSARLTDSETGKLIWSDRWTRPTAGILALEAEIIDRIAGPLSGALTGGIARAELASARSRQPGSLDAYDHFLLGIEAKHHWNAEGFAQAVSHFRRAIALDPEYAKAWSFLSLNLSFLALDAATPAERMRLWREANEAAEHAYALDPDDPEILWRIARERAAHGEIAIARRMLHRAVAVAHGNADVLMVAAWTSHYAGVRGNEPLNWARRAHQLTSIRPAKYTISLGLAAFSASDYGLCANTLRNAPPSLEVLAHAAAAEALLGNIARARELVRQLKEAHPDFVLDDLFGPNGLDGFDDLEDLRRGAGLAGLPVSRVTAAQDDA